MSLAEILGAIRLSGESQCSVIEQAAYTQQRAILAEARMKAAELKDEVVAAAIQPAFREHARILHRAHLEALRIAAEARESLIETVLSQARGQLASFRNHRQYPQVLRKLVQQALAELHESVSQDMPACLQADPRDQDLLQEILDSMKLDINVDYVLESWGGVKVLSQDQRVVVVNTLESRLDHALPYLRRCLSALLEGGRSENEFSLGMEEIKA